ncbi:MAG: hypothetical protein WD672_10895 [Woeseia sp.]
MTTKSNWMRRIRTIGKQKSHERVLAYDKVEVMTATQACRFKELQYPDEARKEKKASSLKDQSTYTLAEASARMAIDAKALLTAAAAGQVRCYLTATGLRGQWQATMQSGQTTASVAHASPKPEFLALAPEDCRQIASFGSTNVTALHHHSPGTPAAIFTLQDPQWVDADRLLLQHPLPRIAAQANAR